MLFRSMKGNSTYSFGALHNYYTTDRMVQFVSNILRALKELQTTHNLNYEVYLKHKRDRPNSDPDYFKFLDETLQDSKLTILTSNTNLFDLLQYSDLSFAIPYTSTPYVSTYLSKPSIFYDPDGTLFPDYEITPLLSFVNNYDSLISEIISYLALSPNFK